MVNGIQSDNDGHRHDLYLWRVLLNVNTPDTVDARGFTRQYFLYSQ